jgi:DNA-directed RNA polymerase specialized sigma24 family protein
MGKKQDHVLTADEHERVGKVISKIAHAFHTQFPFLDIDDLKQRGWRVVIRSCLPRYSAAWKTRITTFCYRAVQNEFINYMHQQQLYQTRYGHELTDILLDQTPAAISVESYVAYRDLLESTKPIVSPHAQRALTHMRDDIGLSIVEAITMLDVPKKDAIRLCKELSNAIQRVAAE